MMTRLINISNMMTDDDGLYFITHKTLFDSCNFIWLSVTTGLFHNESLLHAKNGRFFLFRADINISDTKITLII